MDSDVITQANAVPIRERLGTAQRDNADAETEGSSRKTSIEFGSSPAVQAGNSSVQLSESSATPPPVLAVRSGLPPQEQITDAVEAQLRESLNVSSGVARASQVITIDKPGDTVVASSPNEAGDVAREAVLQMLGGGDRQGQPEIKLMGSGGSGAAAQAPQAPETIGDIKQAEIRSLEREDHVRAEQQAAQARSERAQERRRDVDEPSRTSTELVGSTGAVRESDGRGTAANADSAPAPGAAVASQTFTQAGAVEANAGESIVTRFFNNTAPDPSERPGPTPTTDQTLGDRSVPSSYFA